MNKNFWLKIALASAVLPLAAPLWAATPANGEINSDTLLLEWAGDGPYVIPNATSDAAEPVCGAPQLCDDYALTVNLSDEFRQLPENQRQSVLVAIDFDTTLPVDYELYVINEAGATVAEQTSGPGTTEAVTISLKTLKNGNYTVRVQPYLPLGTNYTAKVQVGKAAKSGSAFSVAPLAGSAPLTVTFDARGTGVAAGGYVFDFGDGSAPVTDTDGVVEHTYVSDGQYLSRVRYQNASGAKLMSSAAQTVFVGPLGDAKSGNTTFGGAFGGTALLALAGFAFARRR